jgi:phosphoglycolate phosphatase
MRSIGVLWGFGERDELRAAGAGQVVGTPSALADVLGVVLPRG